MTNRSLNNPEGTARSQADLMATTITIPGDVTPPTSPRLPVGSASVGRPSAAIDDESSSADPYEEELANCISELSDALQRGEDITLAEAICRYPQFDADLKDLWGVIAVADAVGVHERDEVISGQRFELVLPITLGDYRLLEEIGRGGMGVVYRATHLPLGREVAVKMISRDKLISPEERRRFFVEAEATARLSHANIVPVYEVGELDGRPFFSMQFVRGQTLLDRINYGPLPQRLAVRTILPVCRAVAYAHSQGIIHRDIKPSNILLDREGRPNLTDFGLAKLMESEADPLTKTGAIIGTPTYMSPEQATGRENAIGPATDVYSIGSVLYHTLTGRPPLVANSPLELAMKIIEQDPPPPRLLEPRIDRDLEMIVVRCLQKPVDLRYASVDDLADDLEAFLRDEPISGSSARFGQIIARLLRETHHAPVLENWGLLWMWHSLALLIACFFTQWLLFQNVTSRFTYAALWTVGLGTWALVFWFLRRRLGPVTFVERQIAHVWGASMIGIAALFPMEWFLGLPTLSLSPLLGVITAMVFIIKAAMLSGVFYLQASALLISAVAMCIWPMQSHTIFGIVSAACFFVPGYQHYRRRQRREAQLA